MNLPSPKRLVAWSVGTIALAAILFLSFAPRAVEVDQVAVERGPMRVTLDHEGMTRIRDPFVISAPVAGRVRRIELEPGDFVLAGETVVAVLEPSDATPLDARARAEAEAAVSVAEAALQRARAERRQAQAGADFAAAEARRMRELAERNIVALRELELAEAEAEAGLRALDAAVASVGAAEQELAAARAKLLEPARAGSGTGAATAAGRPASSGGSLIDLYSPLDGVVLRRMQQSAVTVSSGAPLLELGDPGDLEVVADFLSTDVVQMKPNMDVLIDRWGGEHPLEGRVRRVEPAGFTKVSALGVEEQRVNVIVDFDDPRAASTFLGDQFRVEVRVVVWQADDVVQVPTSALFREGEEWAVFVVVDGVAWRRMIEIGHQAELSAQVLDGLAAGDVVVAHPPEDLVDGDGVSERQVR